MLLRLALPCHAMLACQIFAQTQHFEHPFPPSPHAWYHRLPFYSRFLSLLPFLLFYLFFFLWVITVILRDLFRDQNTKLFHGFSTRQKKKKKMDQPLITADLFFFFYTIIIPDVFFFFLSYFFPKDHFLSYIFELPTIYVSTFFLLFLFTFWMIPFCTFCDSAPMLILFYYYSHLQVSSPLLCEESDELDMAPFLTSCVYFSGQSYKTYLFFLWVLVLF